MQQDKNLSNEVEMVRWFTYLGERVSGCGWCKPL